MDQWGWNPSTFQAAGAVATALAFFAVVATFWYTRKSSKIAEQEFAWRTRAWMSLRSIQPLMKDKVENPEFRFRYENMGEAPAENLHILIHMTSPREEVIFDKELGTIFPHGHGFATFQIAGCWDEDEPDSKTFDVGFSGELNYSSSGLERRTAFSGVISWRDGFQPSWKNLEVT